MLKLTATNLFDELFYADEQRREYLESLPDMIRAYHGAHYNKRLGPNQDAPENHYLNWQSLVKPQIASGIPRWKVTSKRGGRMSEVARALGRAMNRWTRDVEFWDLEDQLATDFGFGWFATMTTAEPQQGQQERDDPLYWPQVYRLSPYDLGWDPLARRWQERRYAYHRYAIDHNDLLKKAEKDPKQYNLEVIRGLQPSGGAVREWRNQSQDSPGPRMPDRGEVLVTSLWYPEYELEEGNEWGSEPSPGSEEGYHGTVFELVVDRVSFDKLGGGYDFIRKPYAYYGPRWGPYHLAGEHVVPDKVPPLGPLPAVEGLTRMLNAQARAADMNALKYKRLAVVDAKQTALLEAVKSMPDTYVLPLPGFQSAQGKSVEIIEVGGITEQHITLLGLYRDRLDRMTHTSDAAKGNARAGVTATADALAAQAGGISTGYTAMKFQNGLQKAGKGVLWYLYMDDRMAFPNGPDGGWFFGGREDTAEQRRRKHSRMVKVLGKENVPDIETVFGGDPKEGSPSSFDGLELEIEKYSVSRTNEGLEQRRALQYFQAVTGLIPVIPQVASWFPVQEMLDKLADALNATDLAVKIDMQGAQAQGQQMMAAAQQSGGSTGPQEPDMQLSRLSGNSEGFIPGWAKANGKPTGEMETEVRGDMGKGAKA